MKYEWKKGDKLKVLNGQSSTQFKEGDILISSEDVSTSSDDRQFFVEDKDGKRVGGDDGWYVKRFEKAEGGKPYVTKAPTHVVIWEEDRDPARLFTSESDAKDFIKTLSDKPNVKKDSILLIEIKSCRKVTISKRLGYNIHKI